MYIILHTIWATVWSLAFIAKWIRYIVSVPDGVSDLPKSQQGCTAVVIVFFSTLITFGGIAAFWYF